MNIVGLDDTDIMLDADGQPVVDLDGDLATVCGDACWKQDLLLEAHTDQGELFYEDVYGTESYGFGLTDFVHMENDEFAQTELRQRIRDKLAKRTYLDPAKTAQEISFENGVYKNRITIAKNNESDAYNIDISTEEVEVQSE